jgi:hypothetical protein
VIAAASQDASLPAVMRASSATGVTKVILRSLNHVAAAGVQNGQFNALAMEHRFAKTATTGRRKSALLAARDDQSKRIEMTGRSAIAATPRQREYADAAGDGARSPGALARMAQICVEVAIRAC